MKSNVPLGQASNDVRTSTTTAAIACESASTPVNMVGLARKPVRQLGIDERVLRAHERRRQAGLPVRVRIGDDGAAAHRVEDRSAADRHQHGGAFLAQRLGALGGEHLRQGVDGTVAEADSHGQVVRERWDRWLSYRLARRAPGARPVDGAGGGLARAHRALHGDVVADARGSRSS